MNKEEILNTFLLANIPEIITQEEFNDVKKAIFKMLKENKILKENSYHNDKVVDKVNWENKLLKQKNQKYKEVIDEAIEYIKEKYDYILGDDTFLDHDEIIDRKQIIHILELLGDKEVSE